MWFDPIREWPTTDAVVAALRGMATGLRYTPCVIVLQYPEDDALMFERAKKAGAVRAVRIDGSPLWLAAFRRHDVARQLLAAARRAGINTERVAVALERNFGRQDHTLVRFDADRMIAWAAVCLETGVMTDEQTAPRWRTSPSGEGLADVVSGMLSAVRTGVVVPV